MKDLDIDLLAAFPAMPENCRSALSSAARSAKEEEPMKRKFPAALLAAAILTLMTTLAIAEGWNVLQFLGLQPDSDAQTLVQPVSATETSGNVTLTIDSAITDGEYLAFDYTVTNTHPETPVYLVVESFTANGEIIATDGTDDFNCQWLPGWCNDGTMMDGEWVKLPDALTADTLRVEMLVGVYTTDKPVFHIDTFDPEAIQQKHEEGCYVIVGGDGFIISDPEAGLVQGFGPVNEATGAGLLRSEVQVCFDLDLKAARASVRTPELPRPVTQDGATLAVQSISITPLQTHIVATFTPENASYEDIVRWSDGMNFGLYDDSGSALADWDLATNTDGGAYMQEAPDGTWYCEWDVTFINPTPALSDAATLAYTTEDGFRIELSIPLK